MDATKNVHGLASVNGESVCTQIQDKLTQGDTNGSQILWVCSYLVYRAAPRMEMLEYRSGGTWVEMCNLMEQIFFPINCQRHFSKMQDFGAGQEVSGRVNGGVFP